MLTVELDVNREHIGAITIRRLTPPHGDGPLPGPDEVHEYEAVQHDGAWREGRTVRVVHRYGDGAVVLLAKAAAALTTTDTTPKGTALSGVPVHILKAGEGL